MRKQHVYASVIDTFCATVSDEQSEVSWIFHKRFECREKLLNASCHDPFSSRLSTAYASDLHIKHESNMKNELLTG